MQEALKAMKDEEERIKQEEDERQRRMEEMETLRLLLPLLLVMMRRKMMRAHGRGRKPKVARKSTGKQSPTRKRTRRTERPIKEEE